MEEEPAQGKIKVFQSIDMVRKNSDPVYLQTPEQNFSWSQLFICCSFE